MANENERTELVFKVPGLKEKIHKCLETGRGVADVGIFAHVAELKKKKEEKNK